MSKNNSSTVTGYLYKLHPVKEFESKQPGGKPFRKREFVLEIKDEGGDGRIYKELVKFECNGDWIGQLDNIGLASHIQVNYSLGGREWTPADSKEPKIISYVRAWKVDAMENTNQDVPKATNSAPVGFDDTDTGLPF